MDRGRMSNWHLALNLLMVTVGLSICFWLANLLCSSLFSSTDLFGFAGMPPVPWDHIICGVLGVYIFFVVVKGADLLYNKKHRLFRDNRHRLLDETLEALRRISYGDFSVMLETREHDPLSELAESVNKMARELGSMENLRRDFVSNVSHEIQSPLTSISGFAALLKSNELTLEQRMHYIDVIETEAKRLSKLSDNLLKLSSLESTVQPLMLTEFRLDKQIRNAALMLEPQWLNKQLDLSLHLEKISYTGDESLLTQVWVNLLHNAVKFTPEHGSIEVSLSQNANDPVFRIIDTGGGITDEDKLHVFERFYKADKARERSLGGNGLGLSLVKKIVELHGGTITVESLPGKGTTFIVILPTI